jgi:two-component system, cell cycle response regulator
MRTSDVLARYGGEEFVILLANTDRNASYEIAERIRKRVEDTLSVTMSIGLSVMDEQSDIKTTKQLVNAADQAVYVAKMSGRNRVHHVD